MEEFKADLFNRYWRYQSIFYPEVEAYFERPYSPDGRPPVFRWEQAEKNIITNPEASQDEINRLSSLVPKWERHKWFRSMNSSQALSQSVFGNLAVYGYIDLLNIFMGDSGLPVFGEDQISSDNFHMEYKIKHLGEPRTTSLDGFISGSYRVAMECKFTESEFGSCSRPLLKPSDSNYNFNHCNGSYTKQKGRKENCSLSEIGVLYWRYIPDLFYWKNTDEIKPCPVNKNYQLVRNVLAACVEPDGYVSDSNGHVVIIYDQRNPAFHTRGKGLTSFNEIQNALRTPAILRKCSWQQITEYMRNQNILPWLTEQLEWKYGL